MLETYLRDRLKEKEILLMTHIVLGYPSFEASMDIVESMVDAGVDLMELQIPFSEPIADGPVIQASYTRAFDLGIRVCDIMSMLQQVASDITTPLVTMVSYAIILRHGPRKYIETAKSAGVAGAIVPDLPIDEAVALATLCRENDFDLIQLVAPTTPRERALQIAQTSTGFLYYVSVTGITGERAVLPADLAESVHIRM